MREDDPDKGEPISGIRPRGKVCSLHVGKGRAVTTWDEEADVCWLLAWNGFHRNGHPKDAYQVFLELHINGDNLLPSPKDYEVFFDTSDTEEDDYGAVSRLTLLEELAEISADLLREARDNPNIEAVRTFRVNGGRQIMCIDAVVEPDGRAEEGWMGLRLPEDEHLSDNDVYELLAALLPGDVDLSYEQKFRDRERMAGEIVWRWTHFE